MADEDFTEKRKGHRKAHSGRKAEKKKAKNPHVQEMTAKQRNPKAFAIQSVVKAQKRFRRTMDIKSKTYHVPAVDRTPLKPPPAIVAIVGPPKVGKTTLLQCLIKNFTRQNISSAKGPITLVSGKKKRVTLIECTNDINNMIDIAKIADLVLLVIDAKSGFEMETFEFLNICQVHGMPRIIGVLTHLDLFKNKKALQKTKTAMKKRYRTELPMGEKMFYLSGLVHGEYLKNEVHNLSRFISVMKFQLSSWKKSHPFILADRIEDITDPDLLSKDPICNRTICLYGYARGSALKKNSSFHIAGCGDYFIKNIQFLPDPCSLPEKHKKRSLNEKERLIYAPMSGLGGVLYDKDAVYIELKGSHSHSQRTEESKNPTDVMVNSLMVTDQCMDEKMAGTQLSLFSGADPLTEEDIVSMDVQEDNSDSEIGDENETSESEEEVNGNFDSSARDDDDVDENNSDDSNGSDSKHEEFALKKHKKKVRFADEAPIISKNKSGKKGISKSQVKSAGVTSDDDSKEIGHLKWKDELVEKAANAFYRRQQESVNLQKLVYGKESRHSMDASKKEKISSEDEVFGGLFLIRKSGSKGDTVRKENQFECSKFVSDVMRDWSNKEVMESIKDCFVTGKWSDKDDAKHLLEEDDALYGDFEDLEGLEESNEKDEQQEKPSSTDEKSDTKGGNDKKEKEDIEKTRKERRLEKARKMRETFEAMSNDKEERAYHDDLKDIAEAQGELNRQEFEELDDDVRVHYEGYRPGLYVRLEIENMPCEFIKNFDPSYPIIIGALLSGEDKMGYVQVRIKKHRWYPKILKTRDPLIISLGWRRFQTIPLYFIKDDNGRNRLLKYTPKHLHCLAAFWGPITPQKTGLCAVQTLHEVTSDFRVAALGSITEVNQTTDIVKKLKLAGTPFQIFKKTAFIEGMFHSALECAMYEGAGIRTASGIRGIVKKALQKPAGVFRATFEDKILMSDMVFLRTWVKVEVPQFCTPVCTLLLPPEQKMKWQGMKTLGRLRYEKDLHAPVSQDSLYTPIERKLKQFAPLPVPKNIQKGLPFRDKIIHTEKKKEENNRVAVIREPHERQVAKMLSMLKTVHDMKTRKANYAMWLRARAHRKQKRNDEAQRHKKLQERKKRILRYKKPKTVKT